MRRAALTLALAITACAPPATELIVVVDTNLRLGDEFDEVVVFVTGPAGLSTEVRQTVVGDDAPELPLTLGLSPVAGASTGPVELRAEARLRGATIVDQERVVTLRQDESTTLRLLLLRGCVNRNNCPNTCGELGCERADIEPGELEVWTDEDLDRFSSSDPCVNNRWDDDNDGFGALACGGLDCDDGDNTANINARERCADEIDNDCDDSVDEVGCE